MSTSIIGFPRVGKDRELKFATEGYFKGNRTAEELINIAKGLRKEHWNIQKNSGLDYIPSNDFSFYDNMLDTAILLNIVPKRYKDLNLESLDEYFALARGYQGKEGDVKALSMKKWFNTNYHYLVPEIDDDVNIKLVGNKVFEEFIEAKEQGIHTKPTIIGPFTFLKLAKYTGKNSIENYVEDIAEAYSEIISKLEDLGAEWIQIDEPILVKDSEEGDIDNFKAIYAKLLSNKGNVKILLQTYFGDIRDYYNEITVLGFDGIGIDFIEGKKSLDLVAKNNFPKDKILFAGVVNGKNIWRNDYSKTVEILNHLKDFADNIVINTSCSLLHVPFSLDNEKKLEEKYKAHFAFAEEKLAELAELKKIMRATNVEEVVEYQKNKNLFELRKIGNNEEVQRRVNQLKPEDFIRLPEFNEREKIQKEVFQLPDLPTTTIGSFPQVAEVKANRSAFRAGKISEQEYIDFNKEKIKECIKLQEEIGLDVLVHGEFERNDMVEYFGENLDGYLFTEKAWVQSYGTRCVKPPIVWGDISRKQPMTVDYLVYAQNQTDQYVKGMLTGPVTILNWSFPREDISLKESAFQIALAIREEVLDLEANGIQIIQIDEAALREKLPIRKEDWYEDYLDWAIATFRLVHSGVKAETQIHTHMCYSEFNEIINDIDQMDADVISFEASRSDLSILHVLKKSGFKTEIGPGVYDIHSPRVPSTEEIVNVINKILEEVERPKLWINPDCGLKTRGNEETVASLKNLVKAAKIVRGE